jgi:ATP-dependent helicase/nuclease subunit A
MQGGIRKRGDAWFYYFEAGKVDGKRKKVERKGGKTKKEALEALRKALNEFEKCGSVLDESKMSFADYLEYWFNEHVKINYRFSSQESIRTSINNHIKPELGIYPLKKISPALIQEFINNKHKAGYARNSLNMYLGVISKSLKMAVYPYQLIKENPAQYVTLPKQQDNVDNTKVITIEEFNKIISLYPEGTPHFIALQIGFNTGMRVGEVCGLTWDSVDLENGIINVNKSLVKKDKEWILSNTKTKSSVRKIYIGQTLINILKRNKVRQLENKLKYGPYYHESDFICTQDNGKPLLPNSLKNINRTIKGNLEIDFHFHLLRHTHATLLLESGANIKDIQDRLGHSRIATTSDTYSHVTEKMKMDTVNIFEKILKIK